MENDSQERYLALNFFPYTNVQGLTEYNALGRTFLIEKLESLPQKQRKQISMLLGNKITMEEIIARTLEAKQYESIAELTTDIASLLSNVLTNMIPAEATPETEMV
ncbi:MAG: hypothetical protein K9M03_04295 [Kiritimatiellales bacterium]|nr:hypothetical protein [Kiritimatiellales bacterium]